MFWSFDSDAGTFFIRPILDGYRLCIEGRELDVYSDPWEAAQHVARHMTGYADWDLGNASAPRDLRGWQRLTTRRPRCQPASAR